MWGRTIISKGMKKNLLLLRNYFLKNLFLFIFSSFLFFFFFFFFFFFRFMVPLTKQPTSDLLFKTSISNLEKKENEKKLQGEGGKKKKRRKSGVLRRGGGEEEMRDFRSHQNGTVFFLRFLFLFLFLFFFFFSVS